jgi:hypothetical protein
VTYWSVPWVATARRRLKIDRPAQAIAIAACESIKPRNHPAPRSGGPNVKSDDPRLIESHKRLTERIAKLDDMILTVLKNHIAVEQFMGELLEAHGKKSDDLTFADKIKACKARNAPEIEKPIWDLLKEANKLRNTIAHKMDEKEIKAQMDVVRAAYYAALSKEQADAAKTMTDPQIAMSALIPCGSYIVVAAENKKDAEKKQGK